MKVCIVCGDDFDPRSLAKRRSGGLSTHCEDCSEESTVRYAGISSGEGKQAQVQILRFQSQDDRKDYLRYWAANSGLNTGKNCQLAYRAKETGIKFQTVATFSGVANHKGKA